MLGLIRNMGWRLPIAVLMFALAAAPAHAGKRGKKGGKKKKRADETTKVVEASPEVRTPEPAATESTKTSYSMDFSSSEMFAKLSVGGINPSGVALVEDDLVAMMAQSPQMSAKQAYSFATESSAPALQMLGVHEALQMASGRGIRVAVLDAGFHTHHPAVADNMAPYGYDAIDGDNDPNDYGNGFDDDGDGMADNALGHGTFVAGMVLQVAPGATIVPVRVRDDEGFGTNAELERGIAYAIDVGVDVINLSVDSAMLDMFTAIKAVEKARAAGIVVVVSAGNDGSTWLPAIANVKDTIVVGSTGHDGFVAPFSNYASYWTPREAQMVFAPGQELCGPMGKNDVGCWSGTSFSTGLVSGAVALLLECNPKFDPTDVRIAIADASTPVFFADGRQYDRGGFLNVNRLVQR